MVETVDGLLLTGGDDMDPSHYGEAPHPSLDPIDPQRDAFELAVFRAAPRAAGADARDLPRLPTGERRLGRHALAGPAEPASGGDRSPAEGREERPQSHRVEVVPQTILAKALGATQLEVNSFHHQGIRKLAPGLKVSALSPDGLAEGLEQEAGPGLAPRRAVASGGVPRRGGIDLIWDCFRLWCERRTGLRPQPGRISGGSRKGKRRAR